LDSGTSPFAGRGGLLAMDIPLKFLRYLTPYYNNKALLKVAFYSSAGAKQSGKHLNGAEDIT
jgi:hypothetical protein